MSNDYDVIVVGAGYGGVTCAALLAQEGKRVLLVDKNDRAGGKAMTLHSQDGFGYEMWIVLGMPADNSRFHELTARLGIEAEAPLVVPEGDKAIELRYKGADGQWRGFIGPAKQVEDPLALDRMQEVFGATPEELQAMAAMYAAVFTLSEDDVDALDDTGTLEWLRSFGLPESLIAYMGAMLNLIFVAPMNRLQASEAIRTLRDLFLGGGGRYHAGGYGHVAEACADYLVAHGGTFLTKTRIAGIVVEGGRAVGIRTAEGDEHRAPVVVSNAGIQPTVLKLAGAEHFPAEYVERVRNLEPGWGLPGVRYFLDAPVFDAPMTLVFSDGSWWDDERYAAAKAGEWGDEPLVFVCVPNLYDPSLAPEGKQVALVATVGSPDLDDPLNEEAVARVEAAVARQWPGITDHVIRRQPYGSRQVSHVARDAVVPGAGGECIGLSQVIGQCGKSKPDARTPLPGLYLTGTDAGGRGCGTHQAVDSGMNVAAMVSEDMAVKAPA